MRPTTIHHYKWTLLEGVFERGGWKAPEVNEEQIKDLYVKSGMLVVANDF
ncbi:hypothetical protein [Sulfitobacter guttiformis]|nr:hypothetical protein [Sulfitobacter guttiformis]KIN72752.1 Transposase (Class V) [Sulfitobacter guttiformis KCTC 32187]